MTDQFNFPLNGKTIVVTRASEQQSQAHDLLKAKGAKVLDLPALLIGPPDQWAPLDNALSRFEAFDWIIFSSSNGVDAVQARLQKLEKSLAMRPNSLQIAAVGRKTALTLRNLGVSPDFVPPKFVADSLVDNFPVPVKALNILIPRVQTGGRTFLGEAFEKMRAKVVEVPAYESCCPKTMPDETAQAFLKKEIDAILFTSGKTAAHTAKLMMERFGFDWAAKLEGVNLISIGPQTTISCEKYFSRIDKQADPHDLEGLINACIVSFS